MSQAQKDEMAIIKRGHLGIPEDIMKAGSAQYASMCGNINNKVNMNFTCQYHTHYFQDSL